MKIYTTYKVKIKGYNHIFKDTIFIYREAVDDLLTVCYDNWDKISQLNGSRKLSLVERLVHRTRIIHILHMILIQSSINCLLI